MTEMLGEPKTTNIDELSPAPVPPPDGPHLLPPTPPPRDALPLPIPIPLPPVDPMMSTLQSPGLSLTPGFLTPRSYASFTPPAVHTPGAHDIDLFNEVREASTSPTPIHEILRDPAVLSSLLSHRKKPRRASSSSYIPTVSRGLATPAEVASERERDRDSLKPGSHGTRTPSRERDGTGARTSDAASTSTVKPRKKERDRESDSASILTHVLAEEERQARHLKAVLRQTGTRLEEELRRADVAETRARTAEITVSDLNTRLAAAEAGRHQVALDATRAQEECRRWQMQADAAEREARRLQTELARVERARAESDETVRDARDAARRAEQVLREWQAREQGREEVRRLEVHRRYDDGRDQGFEDGRAEGYEAGRQDGYEEGRDEGYETGRNEGFNAGRLTGFEEGRKASYAEGYDAGYAAGRKEERARALEAFDRFIESEIGHRGSVSEYQEDDRTKRWVEATRKMREREPSPQPQPHPTRQPNPALYPQPPPQSQLQAPQLQQHLIKSPPPPPRPVPVNVADPAPPIYAQPQANVQPAARDHIQTPQPMHAAREPSPTPKVVWLHRPLNHHREPSSDSRSLPMIPEQRA